MVSVRLGKVVQKNMVVDAALRIVARAMGKVVIQNIKVFSIF